MVVDCNGVCGGCWCEDECGVCREDCTGEIGGILVGKCDCMGNVEDCTGLCGGTAVVDVCGVCGGDGVDWDNNYCDCNGN